MASVTNTSKAIEKVAADAVEQAKAGYEQINGKLSEVVEQTVKNFSEVTEFTKGNVEALVASAKAAQSGAESLTTSLVEGSRKRFEETQNALKAFSGVKSPNELVQLQNDFARSQFDQAVAAWSQLSEALIKVSGEVVQPLSNRMALAADTLKKTVKTAA